MIMTKSLGNDKNPTSMDMQNKQQWKVGEQIDLTRDVSFEWEIS